ncbi:sigma 54-interacting transcriptional regulator [Nitrospira lenta]|uniref:Sigma-54 dependent transcriptional regulator (Modular protein) n=1 Tax=Nitrospira lenta TaxID=1436998 RepID=A0A330L5S3_9BACT|nr:sigma 54-interacting transcriptional regulator [Nitrospira lenta]SPP64512.1 Sigma-54 dependent transcriptional regulator (Modular protein) [Nitrospira lenta]
MDESLPSQTAEAEVAQYGALLKVSEAIAAHRDLQALFRDLAHRLPAVAPFDFIGLVLHDPEKNLMKVHVLETAAARPLTTTTRLDGLEMPIEESATGWVWTHQQPLIIPSLAEETRFAMGMTALRGIGVQSVCLLPLTTAMSRLGAIGFGSLEPQAFGAKDLALLDQVAKQVAVAVDNVLNFASAKVSQRALVRERDRLNLLLEINHAVNATLDLKQLLSAIATSLRRVMPHERTALLLYEPEREQFRLHALNFDLTKGFLAEGELTSVDGTPAGIALRSRKPFYCVKADLQGFRSDIADRLLAEGIQSAYCFPLLSHDHVLGVLTISSLTEKTYETDDITLLGEAAKQIAIAVENALNYGHVLNARQELARERDRLQLLLETNNAVASHLEVRDLFASITTGIRRVLKADVISLTILDPELNQLKLYALDFPGQKGLLEEGTSYTLRGCPAAAAITGREPVMLGQQELEQAESEVSKRLVAEGVKSACCVPLLLRDRTLGALNVGSLQEGAFTQADAGMLSEVAKQIALAVANSLAYQEIAALKDKLAKEKLYLEEEIQTDYNFEEIVGDSQALKRVLKQVQTVAVTDSTVLILGETGSGKELVARALHNLSDRRERTFVKLNCAAIPAGLLESELFGHEKGAFTGAIATKLGRFELADCGTLFLDEVGEIPLDLQVKLLRVLQEQEFERLGSTRTIRVNVRLIAATNRQLAQLVEDKGFRSDLYYRLNVFPITMPPLRERTRDIPALTRHFAQKFARRMKKRIETIPSEAMKALQDYPWPGNVRELENFIERAVILTQGQDLYVPLAELKRTPSATASSGAATLEQAEREHILKVLRESNWIIGGPAGTAMRLGMKRTTLQSKMLKLNISRPR